ncbi:signal peptide peptidase SppA [Aggregicoccus sp. 17bor-14]|uniref:signal peptide peptidase SppA n=1 Tax=Myxococcaceae TaxID=31 RepID=UPI00129C3DEC|nr:MULTISPECIES: signal peptide peptidase SppA [Myxococcaceae]MBF5045429.1 signal peptide peptidase SppA [Simulacricoccus sp. 17bor-14]MRI91170.1 signal peptide peptidase SppA [Aggregicoccus sp. 17bor-14]
MKRFLIGLLAAIGVLSLLLFFGLIALVFVGASRKPTVPSATVLELQIEAPLPESAPEGDLASAFGGSKTTVRDVVDALEKGAKDGRVKALVVRISGSPGSFAAVQELRDAVKAFRKSGKKAVAYADTFGEFSGANGAYYLASAFDEVYVQQSGDIGLVGLSQETPFAREAFDKLGIQPQISKRYEYKNAPNTYTEKGYTAPHREATEKYLGSLQGQMLRGIAEDRKLTVEGVQALVDRAPLMASEALQAKLVDGLAYRDEVIEKVKKAAGHDAELLYLSKYLKRAGRPHESGRDKVALVYGVGGVERGKSHGNPLSGDGSMGADTVAGALRKAIEDDAVKAIVFRVDSPGGSYVASDTIRREVQRAKEAGKPVIVSMGGLAASGGYLVSMDATRIVAQPGTLTGSIGVFGGKFVTAGLWEKLGVNWDTIALGKMATLTSSDAPYTPEQQARIEAMMDRIYLDFTTRAAAGRKLPLEKLQAIARGRVWTGEDAKALGLVDALGGLPTALKLAKEEAKLAADKEVRVELFPRTKSPGELIAELLGGGQEDNSDEEVGEASVSLQPLRQSARTLSRLAQQLGVGTQQEQHVLAPIADPMN